LKTKPRRFSRFAIGGFVVVLGSLVVGLLYGFLTLPHPPETIFNVLDHVMEVGGLLSLIGTVVCIAKRGQVRGIVLATTGFVICVVMQGLPLLSVLVFYGELSRVMSLICVAFSAAVLTTTILVIYRLCRRPTTRVESR
jgi:hypothetical protein